MKKLIVAITIIGIVAIISGGLFINILKDADLNLLYESINNYGQALSLKSSLFVNLSLILLMWGLGISLIGSIIILFIYFIKIFLYSLTVSGFIKIYSLKGLLCGFIYMFPANILNIIIYGMLSIYGIVYSYKFTKKFIKKETIDLNNINNKYRYILLLSIIGVLITSLYNTYITPYLFKVLSNFIK